MSKMKEEAKKVSRERYIKYYKGLRASLALNGAINILNFGLLPGLNILFSSALFLAQSKLISECEKYSYSYDELRNSYDEYVKNIALFFKRNELDKDIYSMNKVFSCMLKEGFFAHDKSTDKVMCLYNLCNQNLLGSCVSNGDISSIYSSRLFSDILKECKIDNDIVYVTKLKPKNMAIITDNPSETANIFKNKSDEGISINDIASLNSTVDIEIKGLNEEEKVYGNGVLIGVINDGKYSLLDPRTGFNYFKISSVPSNIKITDGTIDGIGKVFKEQDYSKDYLVCNSNFGLVVIRGISKEDRDEYGIADDKTIEGIEKENFISIIDEYNKNNLRQSDMFEKYRNKSNILFAENYDLSKDIKKKVLSLQ